jgi:hypothetical protein
VYAVLISPISSPQLLRICISALLDQVLSEQLMDFAELLAHVEMRVAGYRVLLQEVGESAIRQFRPAPGINYFRALAACRPTSDAFVLEDRGLESGDDEVLAGVYLGRGALGTKVARLATGER